MENLFTFNMQNFFDIFEIPTTFTIDRNLLDINYLKMTKRYHPDKFHESEDKKIAYQNTITINKAYTTLSSDILRAEYLMSLKDITLGSDNDSIKPSQELLVTMLYLREFLENIENNKKLKKFEMKLSKEFQNSCKEFEEYYENLQLDYAGQTAIKMRYLARIDEEVKRKLDKSNVT